MTVKIKNSYVVKMKINVLKASHNNYWQGSTINCETKNVCDKNVNKCFKCMS